MKKCSQCNKLLPLKDYYKNGNRLASCCKSCHSRNINKTYYDKVEKVNKYKSDKGCKRCGEKKYWLLDFHHSNPSQKEFSISDAIRKKYESILPEMEKCDVLCSNCHRDWHYRNNNNTLDYDAWLGEMA